MWNFIQSESSDKEKALVNLDDISCIFSVGGESTVIYFKGSPDEHIIVNKPFEVVVAKLRHADVIKIIQI